ncbi:hypothetical protein Q4I30_003770 [Leishmania utingensis]|uniref:Uncharacterized protein n=1 Tax=Leishmania utingensis TaxID=653362 RepID=A0AAW3AID0_9TRYP
MQTHTRSSDARTLQTVTATASETNSVRTGGSSASNSPSHRLRRSNLPAPLAPEVLSRSLPVSQRPNGVSSCPVNRTSRPAPGVPPMPALSPTASPLAAQGRSPPPHLREAYQRRVHPASSGRGGSALPRPPASTPMQASPSSVEESIDGNYRRGSHHARSSMNSCRNGSGLEKSNNTLGLRTHELTQPMPSMSSRLPSMTQPNKLSTSATASSNMSMAQPPTQQQSASTATMPMVPTSPARLVSQPDVTLLSVTSPARRCCLVAESSDRSVETAPASTVRISLPPPPLPPAPAPAPRTSSTLGVTPASNSGTRDSSHQGEAEARTAARDGRISTEASLRGNPRVRTLVNNLYQNVITIQPEEPLQYLAQLRASTVPQVTSTQLVATVTQRGEVKRALRQQSRTVPQSRQLLDRGNGSTHQPDSHLAAEASTSSASVSAELRRDSSETSDSDGGQTRAGSVQLTPQQPASAASRVGEVDLTGSLSSGAANRSVSLTAPDNPVAVVRLLPTSPSAPQSLQPRAGSSGTVVDSLSMPQSIAGTVTRTSASSNVSTSGIAASKHGSLQSLPRPGVVANGLASSGFFSGFAVGCAGHQTGSSVALLQHGGGSGSTFRSSGGAAPHSMVSLAGSVSGVDRGETTPSDLSSLFSINSVDLHEFMAEFRLAKEEHYGGSVDHPTITLDELACIIESSSFPCTDAEVLLDLFDELQSCAQYLAGVWSPTCPPPEVSATRKRNSSPPQLHGALGAGSLSSVSFDGAVTATAAVGGSATRKLRGVGNVSGPTWPAGRVQGAESCVTAAHPSSSIAAQDVSHGYGRLADEAQDDGDVTVGGRTDAKDGKALAIDSRTSEGLSYESPGRGGIYNPYSRSTADVLHGASPLQRQQGMLQHPYPDAKDIEDGEAAPRILFDTLLARMAYKLHGRYPSEAIRIAFYGMVVDEESVAAALESSGRSAGIGADGASLGANGRSLRGVVSTDSLTPSEVTAMGSGSAGMETMSYGTLPSCTVPLSRCIAEGLFARLGMVDMTAGELQRGLRSAGLPTDQDEQRVCECHLEDFARLVRTITAVSERGSSVSPANPLLSSLRESYLQRGSIFTVCNNNTSGGTVPATSTPWKE